VRTYKDKALILRVRNPQKITTLIPKSKILPSGEVAVNWGIEEAQVLKNIGIRNVPSPITARYNWPGIYTPFEHQRVTAEFLTLHRRAFCFSQPGTGKTGASIWAADYLMTVGEISRVLIVCPLSIMDTAWRGDMFQTAMHRKVDIAHGNAKKRKTVIESDAEFVITNYDTLVNSNELLKYAGFDLIIVDEASGLKNAQTKRWKALRSLVGPDTWLWMMTGTPAAQSPVDAYGLAKLVNPEGVPKYFNAFQDMVMQKVGPFKLVPKPEAKKIVHSVLQPAIRFEKKDCLDLPPVVHVNRRVELTPQQTKYYNILKKKMVMEAAGEQITAANAAVKLGRLLQISCGAVYSDDGETVQFDISNRYKVLMEIINETENKVLIFVPFTSTIDHLHEKLTKDGITNEVINGKVPASRRADIIRAFQNQDDPRVLVIQPQAAAHGVTLTAADTIVWWGPTPSVEIFEQANARVDRPGQKNKCTVYKLAGSFAEWHVYNLLETKLQTHTSIIDLYKKMLD
jgi:SNF2 family DNA or RNA helicase